MTDGNIAPCPIMIGMKDYYLGHIQSTSPYDLASISIGAECAGCKILNFCGGRCLYANIIQPWNLKERRLVCSTIENLYISLTNAIPEIRSLLDEGKITLNDFAHEKFNGCEIIP